MQSNSSYNYIVNMLEDFYSFHPEYFKQLKRDDMEALSTYYFAGRDIDVDNILEYHKAILQNTPEVESKALTALGNFKKIANIRS